MYASGNYENRSFEVFKMRYSLDSDLTEKDLQECDNNINERLKRIINKEIKRPSFRTMDYVENLLQDIQNSISEQLEKLKSKNPLAYKMRLDEQQQRAGRFNQSLEDAFSELIVLLADVGEKSDLDKDYLFLLSDAHEQLIKSNVTLIQALAKEKAQRPSKSTKSVSKIVDVFTAMFLVLLRLIELNKHWDQKKPEKNELLIDLLMMDLDTLCQYTRYLDIKGSHKKVVIDDELMMALWG